MEYEVIGKCLRWDNGCLIILDDDNEEIDMDSSFFKDTDIDVDKYMGKRISFYYDIKGFHIMEVSESTKSDCLCHNINYGNYYLSKPRILWKLENIIIKNTLQVEA